MKNSFARMIAVAYAALLAAGCAAAQVHEWAARSLDNVEWAVHEKLAVLPFYGVFDTVRFEVQGSTVTLSGSVIKESVKHNAERSVKHLAGVQKVVNNIEILPSSRRDDVLRANLYHAIYVQRSPDDKQPVPSVHIIVKNGWVALEGVVDSEAERRTIMDRALSAAAHVSDNLRVAPPNRSQAIGIGNSSDPFDGRQLARNQ